VNLDVVAAKGFATAPQQLTQAQNILAKGTDAIVLGPVDYNASAPIVSLAKAEGVPVSVMGTLVHSNDTFQVVQDDYAQGQAAADALAAKLPNGGDGIVMGGPANATWSSDRVNGFKAQLAAKYPKIKIASLTHENVDPAQGLTQFNNAASAHPKVDWIYAAYNLLLPPASVPKQYKGATYIGGALEPTTIPQVKSGTATVIPDWPVSMGRIGVAQAVTKLNGGEPPKLTCVPSPVIAQADLASGLGEVQQIPAGYKASS
jgi:ribose transport system substrate-binding protein